MLVAHDIHDCGWLSARLRLLRQLGSSAYQQCKNGSDHLWLIIAGLAEVYDCHLWADC